MAQHPVKTLTAAKTVLEMKPETGGGHLATMPAKKEEKFIYLIWSNRLDFL